MADLTPPASQNNTPLRPAPASSSTTHPITTAPSPPPEPTTSGMDLDTSTSSGSSSPLPEEDDDLPMSDGNDTRHAVLLSGDGDEEEHEQDGEDGEEEEEDEEEEAEAGVGDVIGQGVNGGNKAGPTPSKRQAAKQKKSRKRTTQASMAQPRAKDSNTLYESEIVARWNKEFGDVCLEAPVSSKGVAA
ncbi:hypothetical protein BCR39DRAFT_522726 [Naematelia encephala]|uniref:Uncharacterized protein n=1 Tax=Naematelia encephala TaxID=71784 RepID=A0A1Y2BCJ4_9TREE|nr:hypothetical protein BCR39DRAFT_522726 [Naematelia encephala]